MSFNNSQLAFFFHLNDKLIVCLIFKKEDKTGIMKIL